MTATLPAPALVTLRFTVLLIALIITCPLLAADFDYEERWYQIELIVFENKSSDDRQAITEIWNKDPGKVDVLNVIELQEAEKINAVNPDAAMPPPATSVDILTNEEPDQQETKNQAFTLLAVDDLKLNKSIQRLNASINFQPLLHIAWRQPVPEQGKGQAVLINSQQQLINREKLDDPENFSQTSLPENDFPSLDSVYEPITDEIITDINENFVTGMLTLSRGHYLHLNIDLVYQREANTPLLFSFFGFGNADTSPEQFRLTQRRRVKRNEIHYFDHPTFGVLAVVTAVKQEKSNRTKTIPLNSRK